MNDKIERRRFLGSESLARSPRASSPRAVALHATTLWDYVNRAMPFDTPGSLSHDQVYATVAYLLFLNGIVNDHDRLDAKTLPLIKMPNRAGFIPDSRPDVGRKKPPRN